MKKIFLLFIFWGSVSCCAPNAMPPIKIKGIRYSYIHSKNAASLKKWYTEKLGLKFVDLFPDWSETEFGGGSKFSIATTEEPRSAVQKQPVGVMFEVDDIQHSVDELMKRGVKFFVPAEKKTPIILKRTVKIATFKDLDGNFQQLIELPKK